MPRISTFFHGPFSQPRQLRTPFRTLRNGHFSCTRNITEKHRTKQPTVVPLFYDSFLTAYLDGDCRRAGSNNADQVFDSSPRRSRFGTSRGQFPCRGVGAPAAVVLGADGVPNELDALFQGGGRVPARISDLDAQGHVGQQRVAAVDVVDCLQGSLYPLDTVVLAYLQQSRGTKAS